MGKKAVFFDIDGTILNFHNQIPASAVAAIRGLRQNGHLAILCSGRSRAYIRLPALLDIGFDGIISGCGTMLEYGGETLFHRRIPPELALKTVETVRRHGFRAILEGSEYLYMEESEFAADAYGQKLFRDLGHRRRGILECWGAWEFSKLACDTRGCDQAAAFAELPEFDPITHNPNVVELVPKGFHKGSGILRLCAILGLDPAETVAFGDSVNDLGMFSAVGTSVCMGNGVPAAKAAADYVTTALERDGIYNACLHLGLL